MGEVVIRVKAGKDIKGGTENKNRFNPFAPLGTRLAGHSKDGLYLYNGKVLELLYRFF